MSQGEWQRPEGVTKGAWDYIRSGSIANGYDDFLLGDRLAELDRCVVQQWLGDLEHQRVAEFGCGTGRTLLPLALAGHRVVGVDLSRQMLQRFADKANQAGVFDRCVLVRANLTELGGIGDGTLDHAVCLFSTLGMIQGRANRIRFLRHAWRTLRPGGYFIVHAHSSLFQIRQRGGLKWALKSLLSKAEFGDRYAEYRGIRDFFIHSYRRRELEREWTAAGFQCVQWNEILRSANGLALRQAEGSFTSGLGAVGWIAVLQK